MCWPGGRVSTILLTRARVVRCLHFLLETKRRYSLLLTRGLRAHTNGSHLTAKSSPDPQERQSAERKIRDINPNHGSPEFSPREENKENCSTEQRVIRGLISRSQDPYLDDVARWPVPYGATDRNLPNPWSDNDVACARGQHPICVVH